MMKMFRFAVVVALVIISAPALPAQDNPEKTALYAKFFAAYNHGKEIKKTDPNLTQADTKQAYQRAATEAYDTAKEYLRKYSTDNDQYVEFTRKFVDSYERFQRRTQLLQQIKEQKYGEAFAAAKQVLADFPDDLDVLYQLVAAGVGAATSGNDSYNAEAAAYATKLVQLVKSDTNLNLSQSKEQVLGNLNYALGLFTRKTQPAQAVTYFIAAVQSGGIVKEDPLTYIYLADLYETNEYVGLAGRYTTSCKTDVQLKTQECVDLKAKIDHVVDRMIDVLARAIAYSTTGPAAARYDKARANWMETLTKYYKYRNKDSDAGLKELIENVKSKPIPAAGQ